MRWAGILPILHMGRLRMWLTLTWPRSEAPDPVPGALTLVQLIEEHPWPPPQPMMCSQPEAHIWISSHSGPEPEE